MGAAGIAEDLLRGVALTIDYEDRSQRKTHPRRVDPLALARSSGHWYVLAWCYQKRAGRWFRFDRIRRATLTRVPVVQRDLLDVFGPPPADAAPIGRIADVSR
jgi:predicted DNA-binding transcriptional regulator YafY